MVLKGTNQELGRLLAGVRSPRFGSLLTQDEEQRDPIVRAVGALVLAAVLIDTVKIRIRQRLA